jgi:hypothetical protein
MELDNFRGSKEIINNAMDIFGVPHTDSSIQSGDYLKLAPLNSFKDNSDPIRFRIDLRTVKEVLDLRDSFLYLQKKYYVVTELPLKKTTKLLLQICFCTHCSKTSRLNSTTQS